MLKKLAPGDRFRMNVWELNRQPRVPNLRLNNIPADFVQVNDRRCQLRHPKPVPMPPPLPGFAPLPPEPPASPVELGTHQSQERNFLWLPWLAGKVSYAHPVPGLPIITGLMSGCWLGRFTMNGQSYFGHIGTEDLPNTENSLKAKNAWKIAVGRGMITNIQVFNPASKGGGGDAKFGALSANNHFYTITCSKPKGQGAFGTGTVFAVVAITQRGGQASPVFM